MSYHIHGLDHVQLAMPAGQEATARDFYAGLLGLTEVAKPDILAARGGVWFENVSLKLHLGVEADFRPAQKAHPALLVQNLLALTARLEQAGVTIKTDTPLAGIDRIHVSDPFGNRIELVEPIRQPLPEFRINDRHLIRIPTAADADELFHVVDANRTYLTQWLPWLPAVTGPADSRRTIEASLRQFANHQGFHAVICFDQQIVGSIGFHGIDWNNRITSLGYWLAESHQGRGLMTASCRAMVEHAFTAWEMNRIAIRCATGNVRSQAIPERLGFTREDVQREAEWLYDHFVDLINYAVLRRDWKR